MVPEPVLSGRKAPKSFSEITPLYLGELTSSAKRRSLPWALEPQEE